MSRHRAIPVTSEVGTTYLAHFDRRLAHAGHYAGKPESSAFLKAGSASDTGKFAELASAVSEFRGSQSACAWSAGVFHGFQAFLDGQGCNDQGCCGIGPPPPEPRVQAGACQRRPNFDPLSPVEN